jgi:hypothetical protein
LHAPALQFHAHSRIFVKRFDAWQAVEKEHLWPRARLLQRHKLGAQASARGRKSQKKPHGFQPILSNASFFESAEALLIFSILYDPEMHCR